MSTIAPATLAERLRDDDLVVVDIRHEADYADWHIPGSRNVDVYDDVRDHPDVAKEAFRDLPADAELVTVCGIGVVSQAATELLREEGYDARNLEDGMVGWSQVHEAAPVTVDLPGTLLQVARPGKGCLSYVLVSEGEAVVFDPSQYVDEYAALLEKHDADLVGVYETHGQGDHLSGGFELADRFGVPYHLHPEDALELDAEPVADGDTVRVGAIEIEVVHTPGHSPGSVTYDIGGKALLTGDTLFHDTVGRVELGAVAGLDDADAKANAEALYASVQRLLDRAGDLLVLPAHDSGSPRPPVVATLSEVRDRNEDLGLDRATFVERLADAAGQPPPNARRIKRANVGLEAVEPAERTSIELGPNRCAAE